VKAVKFSPRLKNPNDLQDFHLTKLLLTNEKIFCIIKSRLSKFIVNGFAILGGCIVKIQTILKDVPFSVE
jgi:hypothetical protein